MDPTQSFSLTSIFNSARHYVCSEKKIEIPTPCLLVYLLIPAFSPTGSVLNIQAKEISVDLPPEYHSITKFYRIPSISRYLIKPASREDLSLLPDCIFRLMQYFPTPNLQSLIEGSLKPAQNNNIVNDPLEDKSTDEEYKSLEEESFIAPHTIQIMSHPHLSKILTKLKSLNDPKAILWYVILKTILVTQKYYAEQMAKNKGYTFPVDQDITLTQNDLNDDYLEEAWKINNMGTHWEESDKQCATALHKMACLIKQAFFKHNQLITELNKIPFKPVSEKLKSLFTHEKLTDWAKTCENLFAFAPEQPQKKEDYKKVEPMLKMLRSTGQQLVSQCENILKEQERQDKKNLEYN